MTDNKELYIKDITIEGIDKKDITSLTNGTEFKFENNFTILTGLNGSGKTNLLNYLCKISGDKVMRYIDVNYKLDSNLLKNPNKSIDSNDENTILRMMSFRNGSIPSLNNVIGYNAQIIIKTTRLW